jgi:uncharacterized protein
MVWASWATRLASQTLYRVIAGLLLCIAVVLVLGHDATASGAMLTGVAQMPAGVVAGFIIGVVAALLGVAGGELLIPLSFCYSVPISNSRAAYRSL